MSPRESDHVTVWGQRNACYHKQLSPSVNHLRPWIMSVEYVLYCIWPVIRRISMIWTVTALVSATSPRTTWSCAKSVTTRAYMRDFASEAQNSYLDEYSMDFVRWNSKSRSGYRKNEVYKDILGGDNRIYWDIAKYAFWGGRPFQWSDTVHIFTRQSKKHFRA